MFNRRTAPAIHKPTKASVMPTAGNRPRGGMPTVHAAGSHSKAVSTQGYGYQYTGSPGAPAPSGHSGHTAPPPPPPPAGYRGQPAPTWSGHGGAGPIPTHGGQLAAPPPVPSYALQVIAYNRGTDRNTGRTLPYHWSFHVATGETRTVFHQLRGAPGQFYYQGQEAAMLLASSSYLQAVTIGAIPANQLANLEQVLQSVPIQNDYRRDPSWNCQSWCCAALPVLIQCGWVDPAVNERDLRRALIEQ